MTKKREWRLTAFAAFLGAAAIIVSGAQAQGGGTPTGGTNCYVNGQWVFYPSGGCPGGGGGGGNANTTTRQDAMDWSHYVSAFNRAVKLYKRGVPDTNTARALSECQSALSSIDEALQYEPDEGDAQTLRRQITSCISSANGTLAVLRGDIDQGISYYRQAESEYPESNDFWEKNIAWAESKRQQAIAAQQQAIADAQARAEAERAAQKKAQIDALWAQGTQLQDNNDYKGAEAIWRQIIVFYPQNAAAYFNLGRALRFEEHYAEAEAAYRESIRLYPADWAAEFDLGVVLEAQDRHAEAEAAFRQAIQIDPKNATGEVILGGLLVNLHRNAEAEAALRQAIQLDPKNALAEIYLGILFENTSRLAEAEAALRQAIQLDPQNVQAELDLGSLLEFQFRYTEAEPAYRRAIQLDPTNLETVLKLGDVLKLSDRFVEAEAVFRRAIQLDPNSSNSEQELGVALGAQKKYAEAEAAYRKAIELDPKNWYAESQLGILFKNQNRFAEAEAALIKAFQLNPKDFDSESLLSELYKDQKRYAEAEVACRKVLELLPANLYGHQSALDALQAVIDLEAKARAVTASSVPTGAAAAVSGPVFWLTSDGHKIPIESGKPIFLNQHVITGKAGHLQVLLLDGTVFTLGQNSDMVLDDFVYDPANDQHTIMARLTKGVFRWVTGKTARKDPASMKVILPVGTIGPRGTDFEAAVETDGSGDVKLYSGQLEITETKTGRIFLMNAGETVTYGSDGIFSPPKRLEPAGSARRPTAPENSCCYFVARLASAVVRWLRREQAT
jgi:tetratricopeptide (TPR) repeat protein